MTSYPELEELKVNLLKLIASSDDPKALEQLRIFALGKKGLIAEQMARIPTIAVEERANFGSANNAVKSAVTEALERKLVTVTTTLLNERLKTERADVTLPVRLGPQSEGRIHPVSQVLDEVIEIFADMGFAVAEGPDIETDDMNFDRLNIPAEHPARQDHDTFYFAPREDGSRLLLRTHTSPVQIRTMVSQKPPIRIIAPGRVYRCDSDQTHTPMFHQVEGLVIDETTHMGHLKWVLEEFCKAFFEVDEVKMRFRASHFPFTEPSMEVDIGAEAIGKPGQWLEILGCGMVHPNVLRNCGLDPEKYQGFAFGVGLDRLTMLKYGIPDLRAFFSGDLKWLRHYGFNMLDVPTLGGGLSA
jgi:phenylalanyl-tRNA synthetase alpha chain